MESKGGDEDWRVSGTKKSGKGFGTRLIYVILMSAGFGKIQKNRGAMENLEYR
jgi:hypothetical protein